MNKIIQDQLREIEEQNNVKILYAIESGSRGWGFESKDSDFDVRFIYVHPIEWYLNVFEGSDIIEIPVDKVLDINGWDLRKAMGLMYKSNAPLLEWLSSPIIYKQNQEFIKDLRYIAEKYFSPVSVTYHYINIAKKSFSGLLDMDKVKLLKHAMHLIRLLVMGTEILNTHQINTYRTEEHDLLMDIRKGKYSYDELFKMVKLYEFKFKESSLSTTLPEEPDKKQVEELLISLYEDYYNSSKKIIQ